MDGASNKNCEPELFKIKEELSFLGNDPGAVKYGNFINYYSFHSPEKRLQNLAPGMFPPSDENSYVCLDIGCNSGVLTQSLHSYLSTLFPNKKVYILAIDIDPVLINRAIENNANIDLSFENVDIMNKNCNDILKMYLIKHHKIKFDVIFCFSVTMWIHLNHGDDGLVSFLNFMKDNTRVIILEPQPWRCYKTAYRRMKRSNADFPLFNLLAIRENVEMCIENIIIDHNFNKVMESTPSPWNRRVQSFHCVMK